MITKLSHATVFVFDQAASLKFYTETLGFTERMNADMGNGERWVTVSPPNQPDLELVLFPVRQGGMLGEETVGHLRALIESGAYGVGVFETDDCRATYEELVAKGVEFVSPPQEQFYGIEAILKDNSGNWFSMTQRLK